MSLNAIVTTYNKKSLDSLSGYLLERGYTIYSTGGTLRTLQQQNPNVNEGQLLKVESLTDFPEILGGRVKTLHPMVYGGLLSRRIPEDEQEREKHQFPLFDLVVVNLYAFEEAYEKGLTESEMIELIDIGGVSLIRAAAKNYKHTLVLTSPEDYLDFTQRYNSLTPEEQLEYRHQKAALAFKRVLEYDQAISRYYQEQAFSNSITTMRYGTNSHQVPATIRSLNPQRNPFKILNGGPSYINCLDFIHSWLLVAELRKVFNCQACASFKHTSPAGVALEVKEDFTPEERFYYDLSSEHELTSQARTYLKARNCDPVSSFGDFVAFSHPVDLATAKLIKREVSDGIIAPGYSEEAFQVLKEKKGGKYLILEADLDFFDDYITSESTEIKRIYGLELEQPPNKYLTELSVFDDGTVHTQATEFPESKKWDLILANISLKYAQSNNICLAYDGQVIGLAAGQQNRVDSVKLSARKGQNWFLRHHPVVTQLKKLFQKDLKRPVKNNLITQVLEGTISREELNQSLNLENPEAENLHLPSQDELQSYLEKECQNLSLGSDAFFPFSDNIEWANKYGVKYIIQPGGSTRDEDVIKACDKYGIAMLQTGVRMFYH